MLLAAVLYGLYLDHLVVKQFEGRRKLGRTSNSRHQITIRSN